MSKSFTSTRLPVRPDRKVMGVTSRATSKNLSLFSCLARFILALVLVIGPERALAARPIGIDISDYQAANMNWTTIKSYGVSFAWDKISEGGSATGGSRFAGNCAIAKAAGIYFGPYHYARYDLNPGTSGATSEANFFWSRASAYCKADGLTLYPMLDVEASFTGQTQTTLSQWVNQWCNTVSNSARSASMPGFRCAIYCSSSHAKNYMNSTVTQWITDIADWPYTTTHSTAAASAQLVASPPAGIAPWTPSSNWQFWQYDDQCVAQAYTTGDGDIFNGTLAQMYATMVYGGGNTVNSSSFVSSSVPSLVGTNQTFSVTLTMKNTSAGAWTNSGSTPYKLGSQNPQDNTTWGFTRVNLPSASVGPGSNAVFTFTATAPAVGGTYAFSWKMVQDTVEWFGASFTNYISVAMAGPGTNYGSYTFNSGNMDPTSHDGSYTAYSTCSGLNAWYSYGVPIPGTNCTTFDRDIRWIPPAPPIPFNGRGYVTATTLVPGANATATANFFAVDGNGNDIAGITGFVNGCAFPCQWVNIFGGNVNLPSLAGFRSNTQDDGPPGAVGGCPSDCNSFSVGYSQMNIQAAQWLYMDDWTCLGSYPSASVSDTSGRAFNETNLYLYPALDTSHGNILGTLLGLNGQAPGHVNTGDCNSTNTLDFGGSGNAAAYGNTSNADAYGFAWVFAPAGAGPLLAIGSDNGNRVWVNGVLKNDTNATRAFTRDQDVPAAVALPGGWSRVLFKIHNFTSGFQGTISLRNGGNVNLDEPSVNYHNLGGYYSYGLGYEQDSWYPQIVVTNVNGMANPTNGTVIYTNTTTVAASGTANGQGPVPLWRTMQYQWGYGLGNADGNYSDVSGTPTAANWSHTATGVTGHRRLNFFAVSKSGRTSFQNSGLTGGSLSQDAGNYARYYDVYVDNLSPQSPSFSSLTPSGTNQINLTCNIPLDSGVNIAPGPDESAGAAGNLDSQNWYRVGDVALQVYRNGTIISAWGTNTTVGDTNLAANTSYTYAFKARDNNSGARGNWNNTTAFVGGHSAWTLSVPPVTASITPSLANPHTGSNVTWTAVNGFGSGKVQYYRYAWDTSPTYVWTGSESQWTSSTLQTVATSPGTWYLHVKGYNGANVENGTYDYSVTATAAVSATALASGQNPATQSSNVTFTATLSAVSPDTGTPSGNVVFAANGTPFSTNTLVSGSASATTASLPVGTNLIAAQYVGDLFFLGSSDSLQQVIQLPATTTINAFAGITDHHDGTITLALVGATNAQYCLIAATNVGASSWTPVAGSTNTVTNPDGTWSVTITNNTVLQFYRSVLLAPAP